MSDEQTRLLQAILDALKEQTIVIKQYRDEAIIARQPLSGGARNRSQPWKRPISVIVGVAFLFLGLASVTVYYYASRSASKLSDPIQLGFPGEARGSFSGR